MDELIGKLTDKFDDIDEDKAKDIINTVADFIDDKLPAGIGDKVAEFLRGADFDPGEMAGKAKGLFGRFFGGRK